MNEKRFVAIAAIVVLMLAAVQASGFYLGLTGMQIFIDDPELGIWEPPVGYGITFKEQVQEAMKHLENSRQLQEMSNSEDEIVEEIMKNWLENGFTYNEEIIRAPELLIATPDTPGVEEQAQEQIEKAKELQAMLGSILENNEDVFGEEGVDNIKEALKETTERIISEAGTNPYEDAYQPLTAKDPRAEEREKELEKVLEEGRALQKALEDLKNSDDIDLSKIGEQFAEDFDLESQLKKLEEEKQKMIDQPLSSGTLETPTEETSADKDAGKVEEASTNGEAREKAENAKAKVSIHKVGSEWCGPCKELEDELREWQLNKDGSYKVDENGNKIPGGNLAEKKRWYVVITNVDEAGWGDVKSVPHCNLYLKNEKTGKNEYIGYVTGYKDKEKFKEEVQYVIDNS